jgi:hypothetical protein
VIELKLYKSYALSEDILDDYNRGKKLCKQLRGRHFESLKALLRMLKKELGKYQLVGVQGVTDRLLRPLKTNRKQLAKWLKCGEKTAYNYLKRLEAAGCIRKIFRGSNASFDIHVNTDFLWMQDPDRKDAENVAILLQNPLPHMRQSLPHTLSPSVTCLVTNEYKELSGLLPDDAPAASPADAPAVSTPKRQVTEPGYHPDSKVHAKPTPITSSPTKKVARKKVPPKKAPKTVNEVMAVLPPHLVGQARAHLDRVWSYAEEQLEEWYPGRIVPAEEQRGRAVLAEFFVYGNPNCWNAAAAQFLKRIDMVDRTLSIRREQGLKAWVPIPSLYFNHRNPTGFAGTREWYKTYLHQLAEAKRDAAVSDSLKKHWKAVQTGDPDLMATATTQIKQYLEKKGGAKLYARFTGKIYTQPTVNLAAHS